MKILRFFILAFVITLFLAATAYAGGQGAVLTDDKDVPWLWLWWDGARLIIFSTVIKLLTSVF